MRYFNARDLKKELFPRDHHHLPVFLSLLAIMVGLTAATMGLEVMKQTTQDKSNADMIRCIPLPPCVAQHTCPAPVDPTDGSFRWCQPAQTVTPTPNFIPCNNIWPDGSTRNVGFCSPNYACDNKAQPGAPFGICHETTSPGSNAANTTPLTKIPERYVPPTAQ